MKSSLPLLSIALFFASCTSVYKSGQTPDDVYFSPARPHDEYVRQEKQEDRQYRYQNDEAYRDDRYLRMKVRNARWSTLYDDYYSYNPYYYHYFNGSLYYNSPWSSYSYWNYYYNPSYTRIIYTNPRKPVYNRPRTFDLSVYNPTSNGTINTKTRMSSSNRNSSFGSTNSDNYRRSGSSAGNFLREAFGGSGSNSSSNRSSMDSRSSASPSSNSRSSSSSSSSSSGSSGSSNAPARRF